MIEVVDSGLGNIQSIVNMIEKVGGSSRVVRTPAQLAYRDKIILPGVGAFDTGIAALRERGFDTALREALAAGAQLFGICLGMQLLLDASDEGHLPGLGMIPGRVKRFAVEHQGLKVPHMGWNIVRPTRPSRLFSLQDDERRFYFVHSYYAECRDHADVTATAHYGGEFACAVERDQVLGVQFHPEKSHRFGMELFRRFVGI